MHKKTEVTQQILAHLLTIRQDTERLAIWVNAIDPSKKLTKELAMACKHLRSTIEQIEKISPI